MAPCTIITHTNTRARIHNTCMSDIAATPQGDTGGKYSVPVLWDKKLKMIVSNESADIVRMFNSAFNSIAKVPT